MTHAPTPRVALVYDRVNTFGGAERVLLGFHALFPDAPLYTSVHDPEGAPWTKGWKVIPSFLQRISWLRSRHQYLGFLMPLVFESFDFSAYDLVISITSEAAKGILTKPGTRHLCYLLTPTRYLWSKVNAYEQDFYPGWKMIFLPLHRLMVRYLRWWDRVAAQRPDVIIPISEAVKQRCAEYYERETGPVIYPPLDDALASQLMQPQPIKPPFSSFYLCVARCVPYKRLDLAILACKELKKNVVIVGTGSEEGRLRQLAGGSPHIFFAGHLTDPELVGYYQQCTGLLFPGEEDFGLTAVEAMAAGKPVVVYAKSGNAEIVLPGITGVVFEEQQVDHLAEAIAQLERIQWKSDRIRQHAHQFGESQWKKQWRKVL